VKVRAADRVWGRLGEVDWSRYEDVPDDVIDRAQSAFYADQTDAPVDWVERMVMAITGDTEPDILLGMFAHGVLAQGLGPGVKVARDPDPAQRDAFAFAVAAVLGVRDKIREMEAEEAE
jgi:hypothetical protein